MISFLIYTGIIKRRKRREGRGNEHSKELLDICFRFVYDRKEEQHDLKETLGRGE